MKQLILLLLFPISVLAQTTDPSPYCDAVPVNGGYGGILGVSVGSLNSYPGRNSYPYIYYNNVAAPILYRGQTYSISVLFDSVPGGTADDSWYAGYIDFTGTNNYFFESLYDGSMVLWDTSSTVAGYLYADGRQVTKTDSFVVPSNAAIGTTRLRIVRSELCISMISSVSYLAPCAAQCGSNQVSTLGQTVDYNVQIADVPTGIIGPGLNNGTLEISPNPADKQAAIHFQLPLGINSGEIAIYSIDGRLLKKFPVAGPSGVLQDEQEEPGVYLYQLSTAQGLNIKRQIFIR